jgi:hypothetical protein
VRRASRLERIGLLAAVVSVAAILRFWRLGYVALIGDESYYWLWSEHLAPSFFDNPAGVAIVVRTSTLIVGRSEIGIRWLNALLGVGAVGLLYLVATRLFSWRAGLVASMALAAGAPYLVISRFVYTDALQLFLALLNLTFLIPFLAEDIDLGSISTWRFWAAALSMAALLNTKYNAYLYGLAMAALLWWTRPGLLRDRRTWWAFAVALGGLLPTLLWNAAHQWVSFRWQYRHFAVGAVHASTPWDNLVHAVFYLTPPIALLAALGATRVRGARRRALLIPALALIGPIILSPTNSPRNLITGVALLLVLAGEAVDRWLQGGRTFAIFIALVAVLLFAGVYGIGTILETMRPTSWPHNSVAEAIREDGLGWRRAGNLGLDTEDVLFALDYSIAGQLRYYVREDTYTSWGQYRMWGMPEICGSGEEGVDSVRIVALSYADPVVVSERLRLAFREVQGPHELVLREAGGVKVLRTWAARDCTVDVETFLDWFDFLDLIQAGDVRG